METIGEDLIRCIAQTGVHVALKMACISWRWPLWNFFRYFFALPSPEKILLGIGYWAFVHIQCPMPNAHLRECLVVVGSWTRVTLKSFTD